MAETKNIFIPRSIAATNVDSFVKTGTSSVELRNGDIVAIGAKTNGVYSLSKPASDTTRFGIVYNADVVNENGYKGLSDDPRDIVFPAGTVVNFFIPQNEDEIAVTVVSGTKAGALYLVSSANSTGYTYAEELPTSGLAFEITGEKFISIGGDRIATVEAVKVAVAEATEETSGQQ